MRELYEGQVVTLKGFVWREAFPLSPNYEPFSTDSIETYLMLVLAEPISFFVNSFETGDVKSRKYLIITIMRGFSFFMSLTVHHLGEANFDIRV